MIPPQSGLPDDNGEIAAPAPAGPSKTLKEFLETVPPGQEVVVTDGVVPVASRSSSDAYNIDSPNLELHCDNEKCGGVRTFKKVTRFDDIIGTGVIPVYVRYLCCNCSKKVKLYAMLMCLGAEGWIMRKLAEVPDFGAPTPSKLITLIRDERDYYVKGRRSENQGLGIAAFAYYRRVVEKQKQRIFAEVIRAAKKTNAPQSMISDLEAAREETQFSKAIETIKPAVPQALLIHGQNPLTLLHYALSEGLHAQTDQECLEIAINIRLVLTALVERMALVLSDHAELTAAVSKLMEVQAKKNVKAE